MKFFDPNNPNEKKKMIAAGALGLVALIVLGYVFFGGSSTKPPSKPIAGGPPPAVKPGISPEPPVEADNNCTYCQPVSYNGTIPAVNEANRNIFAYYIPPSPTPKPAPILPTPTPPPPPPLTARSLSPSNVYARTPGDFSLQVNGDKFTPAVRIFIDGRDLPTRFINAQQLFTTVPANLIANPGVRQVEVRTPDRTLSSNIISLNVTPAPVPNFAYVGLIAKPRYNDTAVLQDKSSKDFINVQRGDAVGTRFKVVSISEREIKLIDTNLKITTTIPFSTDQGSGGPYRPPTRTVDDEP
ncbi:MAG TPA: hypothetical protein VHP99_13395 [Pyrinomonadaceae bacterium]|nr:hypothetical protein [Pyrinomonadaceae bacterium]